ncbi:helix-turn-helix domain-containing protein [Shewanella avicenniae]|uniref:Helix-turn-helix domain-containing protein n=1 Tax=Shewanella avicenniae TaxID=2814294 RepID=A0ABX7QMZ2_9GAMM|nr:helix-turn-helix domain-containing protein [Shewanella avicenniae]QSX32822.1 helix-turn-helix domain-containing protein [Shewanella avicenniae]
MSIAESLLQPLHKAHREVRQLVENRTLYESHGLDLAIYDTYEEAERVQLDADQVLYCAMLSGKKVLHGEYGYDAAFLPNESFVMSPGDKVFIDFPEASAAMPTTCLTLSFSPARIIEARDKLARQHADIQLNSWCNISDHHLHITHSSATQHLLLRIAEAFMMGDHDRDLVLNFGADELLSRMARQYGHQALMQLAEQDPEQNALTAVLSYIDNKLHHAIEVEDLCKVACMSRSKLYQQFAALAGCSPMEYIQQQRLHRAKQLLEQGQSVTQAFLSAGFVNAAHFSRRFQQHFGVTPKQYAINAAHKHI